MNSQFIMPGSKVLLGLYLFCSHITCSSLVATGPTAREHTVYAALGAFLLLLGLAFLIKNLKAYG
jgi:hypothetical protein